MIRFERISLRSKILISTFAVIVFLSIGIALATRLIVVASLTSELKLRGIAIAQSIADRSKGYVLTKDNPNLVSLVFDAAQLEERKQLIAYIFILDEDKNVLSHSFMRKFPQELTAVNSLPAEKSQSTKLVSIDDKPVYDIAVPIREGIYKIGTVHVGLNKQHIDNLIAQLGLTYLGTLSLIVVFFFWLSHWSSKYLTRPIMELIKVSDEISKGNLGANTEIERKTHCWIEKNCEKKECPAYEEYNIPCWYIDETHFSDQEICKFPEKLELCYDCNIYKSAVKDEIKHLEYSFINMTNRLNRSQIKLKESEEKYRSLFDSGPNPIFVFNRQTFEILDANPSAEELYGYTKAELIGKSFVDIQPFEYRDRSIEQSLLASSGDSCWITTKVLHYKKGNKPFYVNVHTCPTRYKEIEAMIVAVTDITEMIEKDTQLIQASKMTSLGEMSAGIAHELNQPLNAIKMGSEYLQMMLERHADIPEQDLSQVAIEISGQVDRASDIIHHLRDFSRKAEFSKRRIDINTAVKGALDILGHELKIQDITVELDLNEKLPQILAHNNRLEQVIFNLVTNARDAIIQKAETQKDHSERTISISSFQEDERVGICIKDTGAGIPKNVMERIYEPFFTTKEAGKGLGLGLYVTYGIIKDYDGEIVVETEEGRGTTFKVTFPCAL